MSAWTTGIVAAAVAYLLLAYAIGGPVTLVRVAIATMTRRRLRFRGVADDVLASSRFTIPVSVIITTDGEPVTDAVEHLLGLNYPEFEVIVVNNGSLAALGGLRERFALSAYEVFYRRTLPTPPVRGLYRSTTDARLLVIDTVPSPRGAALNCGANLARFRYLCCADREARYRSDALLDTMRAALENPAQVVGITTTLTPSFAEGVTRPSSGFAETLQRLGSLRTVLARSAQRRLGLALDTHPGFIIWRRDVVVEAGGFTTDSAPVHLEMTFRAQRHLLRAGESYTILNVTEPIGEAPALTGATASIARRKARQQAMAAILWRYRGMLLNPRYGRIGLFNLPWYLFAAVLVPWIELACLIALPFAVVTGVLTGWQLVLVALAVALGNGVRLNTAMLLAPAPLDDPDLVERLLLAPLEVFVWRPVQLTLRIIAMLRAMLAGESTQPAAGI